MPDPAPASPTPGDNAPTVTIAPASTVIAGADDNAGLLADLEAELSGKPAPAQPVAGGGTGAAAAGSATADDAEASPDEPAAASDDDDESAAEPALEDEDLEDDDEPADDTDDDDPAIAAEADRDPALKARLDAVRRTEERQRQRLTAERQTLERERQQFTTERGAALQRIQQFDQLAARAKYDLPSVVRALGIEPADYEYHAQSLMAHSPKFAADEKYRGAAEKAMRERELADKAAANEKKLADLESKIEAKEAQAAADREVDTLFARTMRRATEATPITQALVKSSPKAARAALTITAYELGQKLGRLPKSAELLAAHEQKEARALALRGIKPAAKVVQAPPTNGTKPAATGAAKPNGQPAPGKPGKPTPAAAAQPATPATAAAPADPRHAPTRDELLQELQSGAAT